MRPEQQNALRDVFTALTDGDPLAAANTVEALAVGDVERLFGCAVLVDLAHPVAQVEQTAPWAIPVLRKLLAGSGPRQVDPEVAAVRLGRAPAAAGVDPERGTILVLRPDALRHLLRMDFPDIDLTAVEIRILFHLVAGLDLREMAALDGVGYETRRGQFKTLAAKLATPRQIDLVRMLLGRLLVMLGRPESGTARHALFFRETGEARSGGGRPFVLQGPDGAEVRAVEVGARSGRPMIVLHPQAWPLLLATEPALLENRGLRTLWPLRPGALAPGTAPLPLAAQRDRSLEDIRTLHDLFCDGPVPLVGLISGAPFAIDAIRAMPDRFESLTLVGACYRPRTTGTGPGSLRRGLYWIARTNPGFMDVALRLLTNHISRPGAYNRALLHHYADSPADLTIIHRTIRDRLADTMQQRFGGSMASIRNDLLLQAGFDWSVLHEVTVPIRLIHGAEDPVHPVAAIRALADSLPNASVDVIDGAGQLLMLDHLETVLDRLSWTRAP